MNTQNTQEDVEYFPFFDYREHKQLTIPIPEPSDLRTGIMGKLAARHERKHLHKFLRDVNLKSKLFGSLQGQFAKVHDTFEVQETVYVETETSYLASTNAVARVFFLTLKNEHRFTYVPSQQEIQNLPSSLPFEVLDAMVFLNHKSSYSPMRHLEGPRIWGLKLRMPSLGDIWVSMGAALAEKVFGTHLRRQDSGEMGFFDAEGNHLASSGLHAKDFVNPHRYNHRRGSYGEYFNFEYEDFSDPKRFGSKSAENLIRTMSLEEGYTSTDCLKKTGLTKVYKAKLKPLVEELMEAEEFITVAKIRSVFSNSGRAISKVSASKVLNEEFSSINTATQLKDWVQPYGEGRYGSFDEFFENLPTYRSARKAAVKRDADRALTKIFDELQEMPFTAKSHPTLYKAIEEAKIPINIFFPNENGETFFLVNDQFDLWEEMLAKHEEVTCRIASEAARRKSYEKDLMSYFYFVLYALPEYLAEHAGGTWTCSPRLVESEYELEPEAVEEDRGVIKKRSALTPVADNQKRHVVVPYASMAISGAMTTYCYSHSFHVLRRGMMFDGNVVTEDLQKKLNGKDDYGLMFYTFTGSYTNRGYPTFLIIFERLKKGKKTRVHFHRVHPMRSKDGDRNPVNNWTQVCYNWMIGNVHKDRIAYQQGDLAFIRLSPEKQAKVDMSDSAKVTTYDSHDFQTPVEFKTYEGKVKHLLGHVRLEGENQLIHPEHDNVKMSDEGIFEVRQCRSWEANPRGIWTLNFD